VFEAFLSALSICKRITLNKYYPQNLDILEFVQPQIGASKDKDLPSD